ncbi:glycosyltransferase [Bacteroides faecis]|uniref:glycosyltransferase n=1 Tax=Bacteroides faecis TaxID=674529 RepID=UPI002165F8B2|nr:glycosyltransferase [Bacteroides faecis]MCS2551299.1 glycosyltransferase [Bacteroides faecis]
MAALIKKCTGRPFVYNLQDIFPDSLVGAGFSNEGSILWKIGRVIENFTYKNADKIVVISEAFKQNIMAKGVPENKIEVVYNWVDQKAVVPVEKEYNPLFEELGINKKKFHVVYAGNLGNAQNIDVIIDSAMEMVGDKEVEFLIFGTGGLKEQFVGKGEELRH